MDQQHSPHPWGLQPLIRGAFSPNIGRHTGVCVPCNGIMFPPSLLGSENRRCLSQDDPIQKEALDLCVKQHSMGFIHLMVRVGWAWAGEQMWPVEMQVPPSGRRETCCRGTFQRPTCTPNLSGRPRRTSPHRTTDGRVPSCYTEVLSLWGAKLMTEVRESHG